MEDLQKIAQLLLSPEQHTQEIALTLIKSQDIKIDFLYEYIKTTAHDTIESHIKNTTFPNIEHSYEQKHFYIAIPGVFIYMRIRHYTYTNRNDEIFLEVWDIDKRHIAGHISPPSSLDEFCPSPTIELSEVTDIFTELVINKLKTL